MRETEGLEQSVQYIFRTITEGIKSRLGEKRSDGEGEMVVVTEEDKKRECERRDMEREEGKWMREEGDKMGRGGHERGFQKQMGGDRICKEL